MSVTKKRITLSPEQRKIIADRYVAGETPDDLAVSFGVCAGNIRTSLLRQGVALRDRSAARTTLTHWKEAFDVLTDTAKYWIGFLFADGSLYNTGVGTTILDVGIAERDLKHLIKLRTYLKAEHTIKKTNRSSTIKSLGDRLVTGSLVRFSIRSREISIALAKHGMKAKSLDRVATSELADSRDFWRGLLDGDGWICISNEKPRIGVCGGKELIEQFMAFLKRYSLGLDTTIRKQGTIYRVDFNSGSAIAIIKLLYSNVSVDTVLNRKAIIAKHIMTGDKPDTEE